MIYDNQGNVKKLIFGSREITERKSLEQELKNTYHIINNSPWAAFIDITKRKQTENKLQVYSRELEKLNETREIFTDILRHDLLNPVSIIKGFAELLYKKETDEKKIHMLEKIINNNEKALELIENAGNLAKIECMDHIDYERLDVGHIIENVIDSLQDKLTDKNMDIVFVNHGGYYAYVNTIIEQAFSNLISNSIKYSPENSDIVVDVIDEIDYWQTCIKDSGPGIPDEDKEIIFDRLGQGDGKKVSGKGLGK